MSQFVLNQEVPRGDHSFAYSQPEPSASSEAAVLQRSWKESLAAFLERSTTRRTLDVDVHPLTHVVSTGLGGVDPTRATAIRSLLRNMAIEAAFFDTEGRPPLRLSETEDGAILVEWIFEDRRLGFSFEHDMAESGWYFVRSNGSSDCSVSGLLSDLNLRGMLARCLGLV